MEFKDPKSRNEAIIQNILGADNALEPAQSREEEILLAILNNTSYTKEPKTRIEELLLCILNGTTTTLVPRSRNEQILVAKINGQKYTKDPKSRMEELLIQWLVTYEDVTVSGSTVSFSDAAEGQKLVHCIADIDAVQDLNGQSAPYPAGGGSNIWDEEWELGYYNANTGEPVSRDTLIRTKNFIPVFPNTTYYLSAVGRTDMFRVFYYDDEYNFISSDLRSAITNATITTPNDCHYMRFWLGGEYGTTYNHDISINYPASVTTYSPYSNICPISGWQSVDVTQCGINLWDEEWELGQFNNSTGQPYAANDCIRTKNFMPVKPSTTYYTTYGNGKMQVFFYQADETFISQSWVGATNLINTPAKCYKMKFRNASAYGTTYNNDISINYPSSDTAYHAYTGTTHTIPLGQTVYGGTVDAVTGGLTVTHGYVDLGTLSWKKTTFSSNSVFYAGISDGKAVSGATGKMDALCTNYPIVTNETVGTSGNDKVMAVGAYWTGGCNAYIVDSDYSDAATFKTAMSGVYLCYELATPTTATVTPTTLTALSGTNTLYADSGDISVTYKRIQA